LLDGVSGLCKPRRLGEVTSPTLSAVLFFALVDSFFTAADREYSEKEGITCEAMVDGVGIVCWEVRVIESVTKDELELPKNPASLSVVACVVTDLGGCAALSEELDLLIVK
jgi:hypothetical protein